jgi:hypothetical protein
MAPVVLDVLRRQSEHIKTRRGGDRWFFLTVSNVGPFLRFSSLVLTQNNKTKEKGKENKKKTGPTRPVWSQTSEGTLQLPTNQPFRALFCHVSAHSVVSYNMADMGENISRMDESKEKG